MNNTFKKGLLSLAAASAISTSVFAAGASLPVITTDRATYNINQLMGIQLQDQDSNLSSGAQATTAAVTIKSASGGSVTKTMNIQAKLTSPGNTKWGGTTSISRYSGNGSALSVDQNGTIFTSDSTAQSNGTGDSNATLYVASKDTVTISYTTPTDGDSSSKTVNIDYTTASFSGSSTSVFVPSTTVPEVNTTIILTDNDLNLYPDYNDSKIVKVVNASGDTVTMTLDEIGPNKGIFKGVLGLYITALGDSSTNYLDSNASKNGENTAVAGGHTLYDRNTSLKVASTGDTLTVHYGTGVNGATYASYTAGTENNVSGYTRDIQSGGVQTDVTHTIAVSAGNAATVDINETSISTGQPVTITVTDADLDTSSGSLQSITSSSTVSTAISDTLGTPNSGYVVIYVTDASGNADYNVTVPLTESGLNTGIFTKTVSFAAKATSGLSTGATAEANSTAIPAEVGSSIAVKYYDGRDGDSSTSNNVKSSSAATIKAVSGTLTASKSIVYDKGLVALTVTDGDLNTNHSVVDTFESNSSDSNVTVCVGTKTESVTNNGTYCLGGGDWSLTFTETGVNTGVFTSEIFDVNTTGVGTPSANNPVTSSVTSTLFYDLNATDSTTRVITAKYYDKVKVDGSSATVSTASTASLTASSTTGALTLDAATYTAGGTVTITLTDADLNVNSASVDKYLTTSSPVWIESTTAPVGATNGTEIQVSLTETGANTGVFTGKVVLNATTNTTSSQKLTTAAGEKLLAVYNYTKSDGTSIGGLKATSGAIYAEATVSSTTGTITVDKTSVNTKGDTITVTVTDADKDTSSVSADTATATIKSTTYSTGVTLTLNETGVNTGIFTGSISTTTAASTTAAGGIQVAHGDTIVAEYTDSANAAGTSATPVASLTATETKAVLTVPEVSEEGATFTITLNEPDGDSPSGTLTGTTALAKDTLTLKVFSTSDPIGFNMTLTETDNDSKVFSSSLALTTSSSIQNQRIKAASGDTVTVRYVDYTDATSGTTSSKVESTFTVGAAQALATTSTALTAAVGGTVDVAFTGANTTLTTTDTDSAIATSSVSGSTVTVTAVAEGTTSVTVTDGTDTVTLNITVGAATLSGDITLAAGWNFVSAPFDGSIDVATIAAAGCSQVHLADSTTGFWGAAVTTGTATPGQGVAAYCAAAGTASYTGVTPAATAFAMATNITATGSTAVPSTHAAYAVGANFKVVGTPTATTFADVITAGATGVMYYNGTAFDLSSEYTSAGFTGVADNAAQTIPAGASFYIQTK